MELTITEKNKVLIGLNIKRFRQQSKLSFRMLAAKTGLSVSYLNEVENGKKAASTASLYKIADALKTTAAALVDIDQNDQALQALNILNSDIMNDLPVEIFGLDKGKILKILGGEPSRMQAFLNTLIEIGRNNNITKEYFYYAALRSYQELKNNYFEDLEKAVDDFKEQYGIDFTPRAGFGHQEKIELLSNFLQVQYNYTINTTHIRETPELNEFRTVVVPAKSANQKNTLYLNANLRPTQQIFILAKEIGFNFLGLTERAYTSSWLKPESYDVVLNNFKASYFANALLIDKFLLLKDIEGIFNLPQWDENQFVSVLLKFYVSPETFLHRLTNILPKYLGMNNLFFLRFNDDFATNSFALTKELHLGGLHNPHATTLNEQYCRRWISLTIIKELRNIKLLNKYKQPIAAVQRSVYVGSNKEYFVLSLARPLARQPYNNQSVTLGILLNTEVEKKIKFLTNLTIPTKTVGETCERCSITNCADRAAPASIYNAANKASQLAKALKILVDTTI